MPKQPITSFEPLDMMHLRRKPGTVLDDVFDQRKRFVIRRKGTAKALLVPVGDRAVIEKAAAEEELNTMYAALQKMDGMVKVDSPDTSEKIDEIVYGETYDETQQEANA